MNKREEKRIANVTRKNELIQQRNGLLQELKEIAAKRKQIYVDLWNTVDKEETRKINKFHIELTLQHGAIKNQLQSLNHEIKGLTNRGY